MKLLVKPSRLNGAISVPGSKSHTIRGVICALLASGVSILRNPLVSDDTLAVLAVAEQLGAKVQHLPDCWIITGTAAKFSQPDDVLDLKNSGTGLRFLTALAALMPFPIKLDGDASLRQRKMSGLLQALTELRAAEVTSTDGHAPLLVRGPIQGGDCAIDGRFSQFVSALLFALPCAIGDSRLNLIDIAEEPYIAMTCEWLRHAGINIIGSEDMRHWEIRGNQQYHAFDRQVPADFSTAAFPATAAFLCGSSVTLRGLDFNDVQGDKAIFDYLRSLGANISVNGDEAFIAPTEHTNPRNFDLDATPDALPILAVALAYNAPHRGSLCAGQARFKETDRIAVMAEELAKMGATTAVEGSNLMIVGQKTLHGSSELDSHGDHRIAMALAVAALRANSPSVIDHAESCSVTYPNFIADFQKIGADFNLLD